LSADPDETVPAPAPPPSPTPMMAPPSGPSPVRRRGSGALWGGGILVLVGAYFLLQNLGYLDWLSWDLVWPSVLILVGLYLIIRRWR